MNTEIPGIMIMFVLTLALAIPLGLYIAKVYSERKTWLDPVFRPIEKIIFRFSGIDTQKQMNWKEHLSVMLLMNLVWFLLTMFVLMNQGWLPLNPDNNPSQSPHLAFNTSISFVVNCNLQHYSGESGVSYFAQLLLLFLQFVSAATGLAAAAILFIALKEKTTEKLGNFYKLFVKSAIRILLPLALVVAGILLFRGTPMTFEGKETIVSLQGDTTRVSTGPVAAFTAIKHVGTNGGGFFGANSAHPFENPDYISNATEMVGQMIIPFAMVFALGFFLKKRKFAWMIFSVMSIGFILLAVFSIKAELHGNPALAAMGIDNSSGAMEGKETRFGAAASAYWGIATTVISTGSVNAMHDSFMPQSGLSQMLAMMTNVFFGGCGVGLLNFFVFIILAVFISGLMVGRTPEFMGKKIEAREMKIAMIIALLHPLLILAGTAIGIAWPGLTANTLNNTGFHGFSEMLYEYTSSAANNGSGYEGLGDNTLWWNTSTGIILLLSRFIPIIGPIAIAGLLAGKKHIPDSSGTLRTDTGTFGIMVFAVIFIITALSFFPALTLGPIAEYFSLK